MCRTRRASSPSAPRDRRWVRIRRPVVIVGGELTLDMLDLTFNPLAKFYDAPLQLKANGGIFLVDDFGRQRMRPEDLLNRWIVPLESRVDYLTLHTGKKFQVPFDVLTVFATNLDPASLADEAFLRRIPYKIAIQDPSIEDFTRILEMNCRRRDLRFHPVMAAYLQRRHYLPTGRPLRACHPRDLLDQVTALCRYRGIEPVLSREMLDAACEAYFLDDKVSAAASRRCRVRDESAARRTRCGNDGNPNQGEGPWLVNQRTDEALANRIEVAVTRRDRRKGLLGREVFETSSALIIAPCFSIHTMFMRFDIDAVFVDDDGRAVKVVQRLAPWRIAVQPFAHAVVELPAGSLGDRPVDVGDRLYLLDGRGQRVGLSAADLRGRLC